MFPNSKTPVQTTTLRGTTKSSTSSTTSDPIKDAYKLKSQIDAVQKSQQSFKTSEIIQIQTKLLTKAWKWINKYGIGSLNQYTKMKKQIQNYDILITTISSMQNDIHKNFKSLHRINKQHSISLNNIQSNICMNNNHLRQFKSNINKQFIKTHNDKQQIVSLLTKSNQSLHSNISNENKNENENESKNENEMNEIELPLNIKQINNLDTHNDRELLLSDQERISVNIDYKSDEIDNEDSDVEIEMNNIRSTHSLDYVDTMSVQTIDVNTYKSLLLSERDRSESVIKLNENSMMKECKLQKNQLQNIRNNNNNNNLMVMDVTNKENIVMDDIMNNLTKLDELSNDFNNFISNDCEKYKLETQQIIKSKLKPLHEILEQRELGLLSELKYLHKEKLVKMKQKQNFMKQNKNYLKIKLSECQNILQQFQIKWEQEYKLLNNNHENNNKKLQNLKITLIKERTNQLNIINNNVNQNIQIKILQRQIDNIKQMYLFTVNSANLHSIKQKLQNLGAFVDFIGNNKNGSLSNVFKKKRAVTMIGNISPKINGSDMINNNNNNIDYKIDNKGKLSNIINKKFNEFIGRKNTNNSQNNNYESGMNLDHVNAVDAQSVSSGNQSDTCNNDDHTNINKSKNSNLNINDAFINDNNHRNRVSVSISNSAPPSEVMTDLP